LALSLSCFVTHFDALPTCFSSSVITDDEADGSNVADDATLSSTASLEGDDDDNEDLNAGSTPSAPNTDADASGTSAVNGYAIAPRRHAVIPFDLDNDANATNLASQDDATSTLDSQSELLRWHYHLGHLPFANLQLMDSRAARNLPLSAVPLR
jgi:hypothetical protein